MRLNVGMNLELGLNLGLDTNNLDSDLGALPLRYRFRGLKENEKVTRRIRLLGLRLINRLVSLDLAWA